MAITFNLTFLISLFAMSLELACNRSKDAKALAAVAAYQMATEQSDKIDDFACDGPEFLKDKSLTEVRKLAPLKGEKVTYEKNPHIEDARIELRTLKFDGLAVSGIVDGKTFSSISVSVSSSKWPILYHLNIGTQASRVPSALGQPERPMKGPIEEFSGQAGTVKFHVRDGIITRIDFECYYD